MKYIKSHIILMLMFVAVLTGCEQKILFDDDKNEHIYQLPENGYIFFNSAISNNTRGSLITTPYLQQDFGVIGYQWDYTDVNANWEAQEQIKPNLFDKTPQQVTYANNIHSYTTIKKWETGKRYSFFAYYPYSNSAIKVSDENVEHTPYLTYTLPTNPEDMIDIMTASAIDMDYSSSQGGIVNLAFKHRLSAIDVQMLNLNDPYLTDGNRLPVYIKITDMNIEFNNLRYNKAKLYIDNTTPGHSDEFTTEGTVEQNYTLFTALTEHIPPVETGANVTYITSGNPLIVIPQLADFESTDNTINQFLNGKLEFNFQYVIKEGENYTSVTESLKTNDEKDYDETYDHIRRSIPFNMQRDLTSGKRYTILLTFTRNATTIDILKDGDWDDHRSEITFE